MRTGDWSKCKLPHYLSVKDKLCMLSYMVLQGDWLVEPQSMRNDMLHLAHGGASKYRQAKETFQGHNTQADRIRPMARHRDKSNGTTADGGKSAGCHGLLQSSL